MLQFLKTGKKNKQNQQLKKGENMEDYEDGIMNCKLCNEHYTEIRESRLCDRCEEQDYIDNHSAEDLRDY